MAANSVQPKQANEAFPQKQVRRAHFQRDRDVPAMNTVTQALHFQPIKENTSANY